VETWLSDLGGKPDTKARSLVGAAELGSAQLGYAGLYAGLGKPSYCFSRSGCYSVGDLALLGRAGSYSPVQALSPTASAETTRRFASAALLIGNVNAFSISGRFHHILPIFRILHAFLIDTKMTVTLCLFT
jgi:hypothetical protein